MILFHSISGWGGGLSKVIVTLDLLRPPVGGDGVPGAAPPILQSFLALGALILGPGCS